VYQLRVQKRCCFSQTALQWFDVFSGLSLELPGAPMLALYAPRHVIGVPKLDVDAPRLVFSAYSLVVTATRLVAGPPRCSQVHPKFTPALGGVLNLITITPMVHLYHSSDIPVTLKASRNACLVSATPLILTHVSFHSTFSQTLLEASNDYNTSCWCTSHQKY